MGPWSLKFGFTMYCFLFPLMWKQCFLHQQWGWWWCSLSSVRLRLFPSEAQSLMEVFRGLLKHLKGLGEHGSSGFIFACLCIPDLRVTIQFAHANYLLSCNCLFHLSLPIWKRVGKWDQRADLTGQDRKVLKGDNPTHALKGHNLLALLVQGTFLALPSSPPMRYFSSSQVPLPPPGTSSLQTVDSPTEVSNCLFVSLQPSYLAPGLAPWTTVCLPS